MARILGSQGPVVIPTAPLLGMAAAAAPVLAAPSSIILWTTTNGHLFLHSGGNGAFDPSPPPPPGKSQFSYGLYTSADGINWAAFNTGILSVNDGQSEGSLAVDGNLVFTATTNGDVWRYDASVLSDETFKDGFGG